MSEPCPCCSGQQYSLCCQPYLARAAQPPTAEALMRSRYSAYVKHDLAWLLATWHPAQRSPSLSASLSESFQNTQWLGLNVIACEAGNHENESLVTFFARYVENHTNGFIYERSRFLREDHRWYYVDGTYPQPGRNDACPCGSGKKYKKCCGL